MTWFKKEEENISLILILKLCGKRFSGQQRIYYFYRHPPGLQNWAEGPGIFAHQKRSPWDVVTKMYSSVLLPPPVPHQRRDLRRVTLSISFNFLLKQRGWATLYLRSIRILKFFDHWGEKLFLKNGILSLSSFSIRHTMFSLLSSYHCLGNQLSVVGHHITRLLYLTSSVRCI